jgi:hypothetical protein
LKVSYLQHENIDKKKWDRCIDNAQNGLIYAYSFYLDVMSENWDALVMNDYEAVMPLTWNKKFAIRYLRQPAFTQQLGLFGNILFDKKVTDLFINKALEIYSFAEINLNYANEYKNGETKKCNLILPLSRSFNEIEKGFKKDLIKNIRKAKKSNLIYEATDEIEKTIDLYKNTYSKKFYVTEINYENFLNLCIKLKNKGQLLIRKVSSSDGKLLATGIFLKDNKRIYKVMTTTLPAGRNQEANHFLLCQLIKEYSEQNLIFDFSGSEIPSINFFLRKFGAIEQPYPSVKINNLSFWKRWSKNVYDYLKK